MTTISEIISNRFMSRGKFSYQGRRIVAIDWHPAKDGSYHVLLLKGERDTEDIFLAPDTNLTHLGGNRNESR